MALLYFLVAFAWAQTGNNPPPVGSVLTKIHGKPEMDAPELLDWPMDESKLFSYSNIHEGEVLDDIHGSVSDCEMAFYSVGNFHPVLEMMWPKLLGEFSKEGGLRNWFYFTGNPPPPDRINKDYLHIRNLRVNCRVQVLLAPHSQIPELREAGLIDGESIPFGRTTEYVFLVKKGNPKRIKTIWDLGRADVSVVTSNPQKEPVSFVTMARVIYAGAKISGKNEKSADELLDRVFNSENQKKPKWLTINNFAHRGAPWSVARGRADVAVLPYQMALYTVEKFPELFEIVPCEHNDEILKQVGIGTMQLVKIKGDWTKRQERASKKLIELLMSDEFTRLLSKYRIERPTNK